MEGMTDFDRLFLLAAVNKNPGTREGVVTYMCELTGDVQKERLFRKQLDWGLQTKMVCEFDRQYSLTPAGSKELDRVRSSLSSALALMQRAW